MAVNASDMAHEAEPKLMDKGWERMQEKTFTKWCNMHLKRNAKPTLDTLVEDFKTGVRLCNLLEALSGEKMPVKVIPEAKCTMPIKRIQNIGVGRQFIVDHGIRLENISAEDIHEGNLKAILGMIWMLILKFDITDVNEGDANAKEGLLLWCQRVTKKRKPEVDIKNFHKSWKSGLAFCAIINRFKPDVLDYDALDKNDPAACLEAAFAAAESLGIPRLIDVEDMIDCVKPDEKSVMAYVSQYYKYFAAMGDGENAARRIGKLAAQQKVLDEMKQDYTARASDLSKWTTDKTDEINGYGFDNTLEGALKNLNDFNEYGRSEKPPRANEKVELEALANNIQLKLRAMGRPPWTPPEDIDPAHLKELWDLLTKAEDDYLARLQKEVARQKKLKDLLARFNKKAAMLEGWAGGKATYLDTEEEISTLTQAQTKLKLHAAFQKELDGTQKRHQSCLDLGQQIVDLDHKEKDAVGARCEGLKTTWADMGEKSAKKEEALKEALAREEKKDALRKAFAAEARAVNVWMKDRITKAQVTDFGNTLETVRAAGAAVTADKEEATAAGAEKLDKLREMEKEMQDMGITDNKYTVLTVGDLEKLNGTLGETITARDEAYAKELARQEAMEAKRIEFKDAAEKFVEDLGAKKTALEALEGEPEELSAAINAEHAGGAPLEEGLTGLATIDADARAMGIISNPHTNHTVPRLRSKKKELDIFVKNYLFNLEQEKLQKEEYKSKAEELVAWIKEQLPKLADTSELDNTLIGAQTAVQVLEAWQMGEKGVKAASKAEIIALAGSIEDILKAGHNRPAFAPAEEFSIASIEALWEQLLAAEKEKTKVLNDELVRQEKISKAVRTFDQDSGDLDAWISRKEEYLKTEEVVETLAAAQVTTSVFSSFADEYETYKGRRDGLGQTVEEIKTLDYKEKETVETKFTDVSARFAALEELAAAKDARLKAALADQEGREAIRVKFAKAADAFSVWCNDTTNSKASSTDFGNDLEAVRASKATVDAERAEMTSAAAEMLAAAKAADGELQEKGITDNRHTTLTVAALEELLGELNAALDQRDEAYAAELEKQEGMEAKRLEFAKAADEFVAATEDKKAKLGALTGEPEELVNAIKEEHQDGAPLEEQLSAVAALEAELRGMGVTNNPHTTHTVYKLRSLKKEVDIFVKNYLVNLKKEQDQKKQYNDMAQALVAWITENITVLGSSDELDNTLAGAQMASQNLTIWRGSKAEKAAVKAEVVALAGTIAETLAAGLNRPEFAPPAELAVAAIEGLWENLNAEEKKKSDVLHDELTRQEKVEQLRRRFDQDAGDLDTWVGRKEEYLKTEEEITTLTAAQVTTAVFSSFADEYETYKGRRDGLGQTLEELKSLDYKEKDAVEGKFNEVSGRFAALEELAAAKDGRLKAAVETETKKDNARTAYSKAAADYIRWCHDARDTIGSHNFGFNLAEVEGYAAELAKNDGEVDAQSAEKKGAAVAAYTELEGLGEAGAVSVPMGKIDEEAASVETEKTQRQEAYAAELQRQKDMEEKRKEFAAAADAFVTYLQEAQGGIEGTEGEPDARTAAVNELWAEGAPAEEAFGKVKESDAGCREMGIVENSHSEHTISSLDQRLSVFNSLVKNLLATIAEEKDIAEREAAQEREFAEKEALEGKRVELSEKSQVVAAFNDAVDDALLEDLEHTETPEEVEEQKGLYDNVNGDLEGAKATFGECEALAGETGDDITDLKTKFDAAVSAMEARGPALEAAAAKQTADDELRASFAAAAKACQENLVATNEKTNATGEGELEAQLEAAKTLATTLSEDGQAKLKAVEEANTALGDLSADRYTDLTFEGLQREHMLSVTLVNKKVGVIEDEIQRMKDSDVQPEQLKEFSDMFDHFDRDKSGHLSALEFKGVLASLGQDPSDEELAEMVAALDPDGNSHIEKNHFIAYMVDRTKDHDTEDEIVEAFKAVTNNGEFVTEAQMRSVLESDEVDYLITVMPQHAGGTGFDYMAWAKSVFG